MNKLYLVHHGIKGQSWGERNGPPYPLSDEQASAKQKKLGFKESKDVNSKRAMKKESKWNKKLAKKYKKANTVSQLKETSQISESVRALNQQHNPFKYTDDTVLGNHKVKKAYKEYKKIDKKLSPGMTSTKAAAISFIGSAAISVMSGTSLNGTLLNAGISAGSSFMLNTIRKYAQRRSDFVDYAYTNMRQ